MATSTRSAPRFRSSVHQSARHPAFEAVVPLADAWARVELYAEKGDWKYERAALKYLRRYIDEAQPSLADVAQVAAQLAERDLLTRGLQSRRR